MKRKLNIVQRESLLGTLDAKVSLLSKDQNLVHHNLCCWVHHLSSPPYKQNNGCLTLSGLAIYIKTKYLKAKEDLLWKLKYFTMQKYYLSKQSLKRKPKYRSRYYYNSVTNLKFQFQHKQKYIIFQKCSYKINKRPIIFIT
jgi:hypothetical protein